MGMDKPSSEKAVQEHGRYNGLRLFFTAFTQIALVSVNTIMLTKGNIVGMAIASFGINIIWTHNVKRTIFGSEIDRIMYAFGATAGCLFGYFLTTII